MATVRISVLLINQVTDYIGTVQDSVFRATIEPRNPRYDRDFNDRLANTALRYLWKGNEHLKAVVPESWLLKVPRLDIRILNLDSKTLLRSGGSNADATREYQVEGPFLAPPDAENGERDGRYLEVNVPFDDAPADLVKAMKEYDTLIDAHDTKFKGANEKITAFLKSCKSVNDAIRKYPDVALYLPKNVKDKLEDTFEHKNEDKVLTQQGLSEEDRALLTSTGVVGTLYTTE